MMSGRFLMTGLALWAVGCVPDGSVDEADPDRGARVVDSGGPMIGDGAADVAIPLIDFELIPADAGDGGATEAGPRDPDSDLPAVCLEPPNPPSAPALDLRARCRAPGGPVRLHDLRHPACPDALAFRDADGDGFSERRVDITVEGVVSARYEDNFAIQDPEGGAYSGLYVFNERVGTAANVVPGARVRLTGQLFEYYGLLEFQPGPDGVVVLGDGAPPAPFVVADPGRLADGGDWAEAMESVLVELQNVTVTLTEPDCPRDFDMFVVQGDLRLDDAAELDYEPARGDFLHRVTGVMHFSFEHRKLRIADMTDIEPVYCGGVPDKCESSECAVEQGAQETRRVVVTEIQDDPSGRDNTSEFLELYNPRQEPIDLEGWWIQNCADRRVELSGRLEGHDYLVLAGSRDPGENGGVQADGVLGDLQLSNGEGSVLVFDAERNLVDQVRYSTEPPWPMREMGESLELANPAADNGNGATWLPGRQRYGPGGQGTPGRGR